jgi:hypothetical protein
LALENIACPMASSPSPRGSRIVVLFLMMEQRCHISERGLQGARVATGLAVFGTNRKVNGPILDNVANSKAIRDHRAKPKESKRWIPAVTC